MSDFVYLPLPYDQWSRKPGDWFIWQTRSEQRASVILEKRAHRNRRMHIAVSVGLITIVALLNARS